MPRSYGVSWLRSGSSGAATAGALATPAKAEAQNRAATATRTRIAAQYASGLERCPVVELEDLHGAARRRLHAQLAQHALVQVLLDYLHVAALVGVDVDRAGVLELLSQVGVVLDRVVDRDVDEQSTHEVTTSPSFSLTRSGISEISSATVIPASFSRLIFSAAVSALPSTIVPACPNDMPGISSMNRPAMNATIGSRESFSVTQRASSASMRPPGSV